MYTSHYNIALFPRFLIGKSPQHELGMPGGSCIGIVFDNAVDKINLRTFNHITSNSLKPIRKLPCQVDNS